MSGFFYSFAYANGGIHQCGNVRLGQIANRRAGENVFPQLNDAVFWWNYALERRDLGRNFENRSDEIRKSCAGNIRLVDFCLEVIAGPNGRVKFCPLIPRFK